MKGPIKYGIKGPIKRPIKNGFNAGPPEATNIFISGVPPIGVVGRVLNGNYTYVANGGGDETDSVYQWYRDGVPIVGSDELIYVPGDDDINTMLSFSVIPVGEDETGVETFSPEIGPIQTIPAALSVSTSGDNTVSRQKTGSYTYYDPDGDTESGSIYKWYRADDGSGANEVVISGATSITYSVQAEDYLKYIRFSVTPSDGELTGVETFSSRSQITAAPMIATIYGAGAGTLQMFIRDQTKFLAYGNAFSMTFSPGHVAKLTPTKVAIVDAGQSIRVLSFSTITGNWTQEGSTFNFAENIGRPVGMQNNRICIWASTAQELRMYDWNGTVFTQVGNDYSMTNSGPRMVRMSNSIITLLRYGSSPDTMQRIAFDGTDFAAVGNETTIPAEGNYAGASLDTLTTVIYGLSAQTLRVMAFTNPDWIQVGSDLSTSGTGSSLALDGFQGHMRGIVRQSSNVLRYYPYNGSSLSLAAGTLTIGADRAFSLVTMQDPGA